MIMTSFSTPIHNNNNNNSNNEFISAYPIYMKLAPRPKVIYIK